jgi:hypothetical protein
MNPAPETKAAAAPARTTASNPKRCGQTSFSNDRLQRRKLTDLPKFLRDLKSPATGEGIGVHNWLFRMAQHLHRHRDHQAIVAMLSTAVKGCGRDVPESEIEEAVVNSKQYAYNLSEKSNRSKVSRGAAHNHPSNPRVKATPKWGDRNAEKIAVIAAADPNAFDALKDSSPVKVSETLHDAACLLERLFPSDPLLSIACGVGSSVTLKRMELKDNAQFYSHLVPSAMTKRQGINKKGKLSNRCLDSTGPRMYLVTECDQGDKETQAAVIRYLARYAPLAMVVDSAGKSLHAWWYCKGQQEDRLIRFFRLAHSLGADPATWSRCQLVRMPLGWRDEKNARQHVHFFDPRNTETIKEGLNS